MHRIMTLAALGVLAPLAPLAAPAAGEIITVRYDFPTTAGISLDWFYFGGDHGPVTGWITSTSLVIENYTTTGAQDAANFSMSFAVPVLDANQTAVLLNGADLGWSGAGSFAHSFISTDFNGAIRPGRFGAEFQGGGTFIGQAYIEFTVDTVPAPGGPRSAGRGGPDRRAAASLIGYKPRPRSERSVRSLPVAACVCAKIPRAGGAARGTEKEHRRPHVARPVRSERARV